MDSRRDVEQDNLRDTIGVVAPSKKASAAPTRTPAAGGSLQRARLGSRRASDRHFGSADQRHSDRILRRARPHRPSPGDCALAASRDGIKPGFSPSALALRPSCGVPTRHSQGAIGSASLHSPIRALRACCSPAQQRCVLAIARVEPGHAPRHLFATGVSRAEAGHPCTARAPPCGRTGRARTGQHVRRAPKAKLGERLLRAPAPGLALLRGVDLGQPDHVRAGGSTRTVRVSPSADRHDLAREGLRGLGQGRQYPSAAAMPIARHTKPSAQAAPRARPGSFHGRVAADRRVAAALRACALRAAEARSAASLVKAWDRPCPRRAGCPGPPRRASAPSRRTGPAGPGRRSSGSGTPSASRSGCWTMVDGMRRSSASAVAHQCELLKEWRRAEKRGLRVWRGPAGVAGDGPLARPSDVASLRRGLAGRFGTNARKALRIVLALEVCSDDQCHSGEVGQG
jgi:hypothetical protein